MTPFQLSASVLSLAALFGVINHRVLRLPSMVGLMLQALLLSMVLVVASRFSPGLVARAAGALAAVDFNQLLLHGMLGYLLFAGALHVDLEILRRQRLVIGVLATAGVLLSTAMVGGLVWVVLRMAGLPLDPGPCLLFGALISPTDPISVLAVLRSLGAPRELEVQIAGESLFNDGVGVVAFSTLLAYFGFTGGAHAQPPGAWGALLAFTLQVGGGGLLGAAGAWVFLRLVRGVDDPNVTVMLSLALVSGGFALADPLRVSGPIAMVVAGLLVGYRMREGAAADDARAPLGAFWDFVDEILNAVLFVLIGLQVLVLSPHPRFLLAGAIAVPIVLLARAASVAVPVAILGRHRLVPHGITIMIWGGLRGGLSVAMALALRDLLGPSRAETANLILSMTYVVVAFSIIVQGTTIRSLVRRLAARPGGPPAPATRPAGGQSPS